MANTLKDVMKKYMETINKQLTEELSRRHHESFKEHPCSCTNYHSAFNVIAVDPVTLKKEIVATFDNKRDAELWCYENKWKHENKILTIVREEEIPGDVVCIGYLRALKDRGEISEEEYWTCIEDLVDRFEDETEISYRKRFSPCAPL